MHRVRTSLAVLALAALAACTPPAAGPAPAGDPAREITDVLVRSTEGWNRRDLDAFMEPYLDAPETSYVGAELIRGKAAIQNTYATSWFAPGRDPGRLRFENIEVRPLGPDHALAVGRFVVEWPNRAPASGTFTLAMRRTPQGWKIIHDHSS